jgi:murein DD-endopeptidase MepM/ murein hydrolase activator NlpD
MAFLSITTTPKFGDRVRGHGASTMSPAARLLAPLRRLIGVAACSSLFAACALIAAPAQAADKPAVGGPFEAVSKAPVKADPKFRALFNSWKRLDAEPKGLVAIPSAKPVNLNIALSSGFGVRSDPFRGGAAGPVGTPIYATADGVVGRTGWVGGYGNLVELEHGEGIQTRYGHLSSIIAQPGTRVKRGQLIGLMGSTGRSTGSHLHYEVRLEGRAVNPTPFLRTDGYLLAMERRASGNVALGGPAKAD